MKILWFTNIPIAEAQLAAGIPVTGSGHWLSQYFELATALENVQVTVACAYPNISDSRFTNDRGTYIQIGQPRFTSIFKTDRRALVLCQEVIDSVMPDVIHIHGTERFYGLLAGAADLSKRTVLSMQGMMSREIACVFGGIDPLENVFADSPVDILKRSALLWRYKDSIESARREKVMLRGAKYLAGRTQADRDYARAWNPEIRYFRLDEPLRPQFHSQSRRAFDGCDYGSIVTTLSSKPGKGTENILEAFEWIGRDVPEATLQFVGSLDEKSGYGRRIRRKIESSKYRSRIVLHGHLDAPELASIMRKAHLYANPSLNENSSNSLAEAMLIGLPCVATAVGGTPTMLEFGRAGILVPPREPEALYGGVMALIEDAERADELAAHAFLCAKKRHSPEAIQRQMMAMYREISENASRC